MSAHHNEETKASKVWRDIEREQVESQAKQYDEINPVHYDTVAGIEAVDVIEAFFLRDAHLSQAFKYMARAGKKESSSYREDIKKAMWWLDRVLTGGEGRHRHG